MVSFSTASKNSQMSCVIIFRMPKISHTLLYLWLMIWSCHPIQYVIILMIKHWVELLLWSSDFVNHSYNLLTWDQAQFERFSYILSNGYRPPECNFQSETKIEPDLRLTIYKPNWTPITIINHNYSITKLAISSHDFIMNRTEYKESICHD